MVEFYGRKPLTTEQLMRWYDRVRHIPGKVFAEIVTGIMDESRYFPTPGDIRKAWVEWRSSNPAMMTSRPEDGAGQYCSECGGTGEIVYWTIPDWVKSAGKTMYYRYVCACARCDNWRRTFPTRPSGPPGNYYPPVRLTKAQILERGWLLDNPKGRSHAPDKRYRSVGEMVDGIGSGEKWGMGNV